MTKDIIKHNSVAEMLTFLKEEVMEGNLPAMNALVEFRRVQLLAKQMEDAIEGYAQEELLGQGEKEYNVSGASLSVRKTPGRWKYHTPQIKVKEEELKKLKQLSQTAAKNLTTSIVDDNGEIIEPAEFQEGQDKVYITFKK